MPLKSLFDYIGFASLSTDWRLDFNRFSYLISENLLRNCGKKFKQVDSFLFLQALFSYIFLKIISKYFAIKCIINHFNIFSKCINQCTISRQT